jgi:hypothetical protein
MQWKTFHYSSVNYVCTHKLIVLFYASWLFSNIWKGEREDDNEKSICDFIIVCACAKL